MRPAATTFALFFKNLDVYNRRRYSIQFNIPSNIIEFKGITHHLQEGSPFGHGHLSFG
ncbi:hypothetical protein [Ureibacillus sp. GCM10028918]|uniref:hypothetical protein n=1 Tax=Ureibacillus sp. GCM10028918 TaxID=3273429 RepID=UPI0036223C60